MRRYLFGNVVQSVPVLGTLNAADAIVTLAGLGFLGLGIQPTEAAEWGFDLNRALDDADVRHLVDRRCTRASRSCCSITGADPGRRGPQRDDQPDAAQAPVAAGRHAGARAHRDESGGSADRGGPMITDQSLQPVAETTGPVIDVRDLRVWYGTTRGAIRAVDGVDFDLAARRDARTGR